MEAWGVGCAGYGGPEQALADDEIGEVGVGLFYAVAPGEIGAEVRRGAF